MYIPKKPVHPAYNRFMRENEYAMDVLTGLVKETLDVYSDLYKSLDKKDNILDDVDIDIKKRLDPKTIDALKEAGTKYGSQTELIRGSHNARSYEYDINIFGYLKVGERSKFTLDDDIDISHIYRDERTNKDYFDLRNAIMVGPFIKKDGVYDNLGESYHVHWAFDFSTVLVRLISSNRFITEEETLRNGIINTILNKMIMFELSRPLMLRIMREEGCLPKGEFVPDNPRSSMKATDIIKCMMVYKVFYNIVNGLDDRCVEDTLKHTLGLVDLNMYSMGEDRGLSSSISMLRNQLTNKLFDVPRSIDKYLDELFCTARAAQSNMALVNKINGEIAQNDLVDNRALIGKMFSSCEASEELVNTVVNGLSISQEDFLDLNSLDSKPAIESVVGFEALETDTQTYSEFIRSSRSRMLGQLSSKHRKMFIEYETEILKLKTKVMNCETSEEQDAILKSSESIGKMIALDLGIMDEGSLIANLLLMLDTYRADITATLSSKNLLNLRRNSLYGMSKYKSTFNL